MKVSHFFLQEFTFIMCFARLAASVPYQYSGYSPMPSTPSYNTKQNMNSDSSKKYNVGYKVQEAGTTKVKKEFSNNEYLNLFAPESLKRPYSNNEFASFDGTYSTTAAPLPQYPYPGQLKINFAPEYTPKPEPPQPYSPDIATNKIFHHDKAHLLHDVLGHFITDVAGHKLKHAGEALESGEYTEPIVHKLSLAKAALLQLLAIIGPLSAIKTIHFVARASDPHPHHPEHVEHVDGYIPPAPVPAPVPLPAEVAEYEPAPHYPPTLIGMILNFVAQLSKFNTEAKVHLIPNLLKVLGRTSSSSAHVSGHFPH